MSFFDFHEYKASQELKRIHYLHLGKKRCPKCDLYSCICQTGLQEFGIEVTKPMKDLTHAQKVAGCPHKCDNAGKECLNCYNFDKFRRMI